MIQLKEDKEPINDSKVRSFIAIETNKELEKGISDLIEKLKRMGFKANWTQVKNVHLTLFFLGDQKISKIAHLAYKIGERLSGFPTFIFKIQRIGFFENNNVPRVLWLGIKDEPTLVGLYEEIKKVIKINEIDTKEGDFVPHITVGRIKEYPNHWQELLNSLDFEEIKVFVNSIGIYSSTLTKKGPIYNKLYTVDFEGGVIING